MSENENEDMQGKLWACIEYHSWKSYIVNVDTFLFRTKKKIEIKAHEWFQLDITWIKFADIKETLNALSYVKEIYLRLYIHIHN